METSTEDRVPAEEILLQHGVVKQRSAQRRMLLGCLGCRWSVSKEQDPGTPASTYGYEILRCGRLESGVLYPLLSSLEAGGVVVRIREDVNPVHVGRPPRTLILPAETEVGQAIAEATKAPEVCGLE